MVKKCKVNIKILKADYDENGSIQFDKLLSELYQRGYYSILVEAGSQLSTSMLNNGYIDELHVFIAPHVLGDLKALPVFSSTISREINQAFSFCLSHVQQFGDDVLLAYRKRNSGE
jgi:riboflavin biosynthesis pyrimidine reductase